MILVKGKKAVALFFLLLPAIVFSQTHFNPPTSNYQPMNIYVIGAKLNGADLVANDEVAAFDGSTCAGVEVVDHVATSSNPVSMIAYKANGGDSGFTEGHSIIFKCWDASLGIEHTFSSGEVSYFEPATGNPISPVNFEGHASVMVSLNGSHSVSTYTLTMQTTTGGSTSPTPGSYSYANGSTVNIQAFPNAGYLFDYWEGSVANPNSAATTVTMNGNKTVIAHFKCVEYTLTISVTPSSAGSTTPSTGAHIYCQGSEVTLIATSASGYEFDSWSGPVTNPNSATTSVYIDGNKSVTANFRAVSTTNYTLTMQVNQTGWGSTTPPVGSQSYPANQVVNISAVPATGYQFVNWTGDVANPNSASTTVTMNNHKTVTANFSRLQFNLTMEVNQSGWGSTTPAVGTYLYNSGDVISILAQPNSGYRFVNWTGDVANNSNASTTVTMNSTKTVRANFERIQYNLTIQATTGGTTTPAAGSYTYYSGDVVAISASPSGGYHFVRWEGEVTDPFAASTTVVMSAAKTISATFALNSTYSLTINVAPTGGGTTNPAAGTYSYPSGQNVQITATASTGYHFVNWTGDVSSTNATITVTMNSAKTVTANFALNEPPKRTLTMQVNQSGWGSTDPAVGNHQYNENSVVTVRALAAAGYRFTNWTGPVANSSASETTVYMDGDKTVTANFEAVPQYTLTMQTDPAGNVGGTTTPASGSYQYNENTVVQIQAFPKTGYRFDHWQGSVAGSTSPTTTVTMNGNKTVIAFFVVIPQYTITIQAPDNTAMGYTDPPAGTYTLYENEELILKAIPNSGYRFVNWNNDPALTSSTITVKANSNKTYKPYFELKNDVFLTMEVDDANEGDVFPTVGKHTYKQGEQVTIEGMPKAGFRFVEWLIDNKSNSYYNAEMTITMDKSKTAKGIFDNIIYRLNMSVSPTGGGVTDPPVGTSTHKSWKVVTITATPAAGYKFTGWTGDVADPQNPTTTVLINGDKEIRANFALLDRYTLNMNVSPSGGGVTIPDVGSHEYPLNQVVTLTATAATGYEFKEWLGGVANPNSASTTITINADKNVTAVFQPKQPDTYQLTLKANPVAGGNTNPTTGVYNHSPGQVVIITAVPATGYHFVSWSGDVADPTAFSTAVTMNASKTVTANFQPGSASYKFTIDVYPEGSGATSPLPGYYYYPQGTILSISATPTSGYIFDYWTGDVAEPNSPTTTVTINADKGVIAHFRSITTPKYTLAMGVNPAGGGEVIPAAGAYQYDAGSIVTIQAMPATGFEFVNWSGAVANPNSPTTTVTMDGNKQVTANFRQKANQILLTMVVDPSGGGNVGPEAGTHAFGVNEKIYITAVPNPGYSFSHWSGDVDDPTNPTTFVILDENKTVTAHFIYGTNDRATLTITANPPEGGSTQPLTGSYEYPLNQVVNVSAAALSGYTFIGWTGDVANPASSTTTVTMSANKSIIANFQKDGSGTFVLSMNVSPVGTGTTAPPPGISMHSAGSYVNISAIPLEGYYFAGWHGEVEDVLSPTTRVKMDKNKEVYAKFERGESKKYNLTLVIYPPGAGLCAPPEGTFTYDENEYVNITTIPNPGYVFKDWTGDVENPSAQTTRIKMTGHKTVIANFEKIAPNEVMLTIAVNPTGSGVTVPDEGSHSYEIGRVVNLTAAPKAGYRFLNWSGSVADPNSATTTITMSGDRTITANFTPNRFTVSMAVTPQGSGSTVPSAGDTLVSAGDALTLVAKPAAGFRFAYWSGDASGEELRTTLQVTKAMQIIANFVELNETITTPKIYAVTSAYKQQSVDFNVRNAVSNLGHNVEYQFDWGDGQTSAWTDLTSQQNTNITMFTTPVGGSGLPSSGYLVNYGDGIATPVQLSVQGGIYYGKQDAWLGEEPVAGTDAKDIFSNSVNCRGAISYVDSPGDELTLHFSGLNPVKLYIIAFYSNRNDYGWLRSSVVTLSGADSFLNLSSRGKDDVGNVLFNNNFSPNTRLPSDNTAPGYVAKFANIIAGGDGEVMLSVRFGGKAGNEYKGKYGSAVMLQEIDPLTQKASYTAFNDLAWEGDFYAHKYSTTGTFLVRARARCKNHTSAISGWSSAHSLMTSGIVVNAVVADAANAVVNRIPDYPEYEYGTQLTLVATPGKNWAFSHWNDDRTDTLEVKQVLVNNQKTFRANFRLTAAVAAKETALPESFSLLQNFPNPFNPTTEIQYDLPRPEHVKIDVFDIRGRWVTTLVDMQMPAGRFKVIWNATDELNLRVPTGLYFYRMTAGSFVEIRRMVLLK